VKKSGLSNARFGKAFTKRYSLYTEVAVIEMAATVRYNRNVFNDRFNRLIITSSEESQHKQEHVNKIQVEH
jgi:hypothetical protein